MSDWPPPWSLSGDELGLVRYVWPGEVAAYVQIPGPSGESLTARLRVVYAALAERKIGYADPAPGANPGTQVIRPPEQVLWAPRHATCLDLAVVLAGACVVAGLHPAVVVVDPPDDTDTGFGHAPVLVRLDLTPSMDGMFGNDVWQERPDGLLDELLTRLDGATSLAAVDPVGIKADLAPAA